MIYRVVWDIDGKTCGTEYATWAEADENCRDIAGWIPNARIEPFNEHRKPIKGPFEIKDGMIVDNRESSWERIAKD